MSGSPVGAGLSAQGCLLPAPTGIAHFSLRRVAEDPTQSLILRLNAQNGYGFPADLLWHFADALIEITGGVGYGRSDAGGGTTDMFGGWCV